MIETARPRRNDDLEVELPGGLKVRASGKQVILIILVLLGVGMVTWMLREHDLSTKADMAKMVEAQKELADSVDNVSWIMTLRPEQREALKLDMPPKMRRQLLASERGR